MDSTNPNKTSSAVTKHTFHYERFTVIKTTLIFTFRKLIISSNIKEVVKEP